MFMFIHLRYGRSKMRLRLKKWTFLSRVSLGLLAVGCLITILAFNFSGGDWRGIRHNGRALTAWEKDAVDRMGVGDGSYEQLIRPEVQKMGPETVPFWLERLQTSDSLPTRCYSRLWQLLPPSLQIRLPRRIPQGYRRNVAYRVLRDMNPFVTNGISELIRLSYSPDTELQGYAISLLAYRAYLGYEPNAECIEAFCSALRAQDTQTRLWAVRGLNTLPVNPKGLPALRMALGDPDVEVRVLAAVALSKLEPSQALMRIFENAATSSNRNARVLAQVQLANSRRRDE
jgi:HEAT repeats